MNFFKRFFGWFDRFRSKSLIRPSDRGLFDPFVPITSLKRLNNEYQAGFEMTSEKDSFLPPGEAQRPDEFDENVTTTPGFWFFRVVILLAAGVLFFRLIGLQISQGQENFSRAEGNRLVSKPSPAPRGLVYDRKGTALVHNEPSFSAILHVADFPKKKEERQAYLEKLAIGLGKTIDETSAMILPNLEKESVILEDGINRDRELTLEVKLHDLSGVELTKAPSRRYGDLPSLGHIIGYIGKVTADDLKQRPELLPTSFIGKAGLERSYDKVLQGVPGADTLEIDSLGRTVRPIGSTLPAAGQSLVLGLDSDVQRATANALRDSIQKNGATSGAAVAFDPRNGDILAMVSFPSFDNNLFSSSIDPNKRKEVLTDPLSPLINRVVAGQYPSGSTIKPFVASAALSEKTITPTTQLDTSEGKITVGQTTFSDWKTHGVSNVTQAIAQSNNIFFFALGGGYKQVPGLGIDRLKNYFQKFGFGSSTGIDLEQGVEAKGLVPDPDWKKRIKKESWFLGDTYNTSIGQGNLLVTPLQLVRATAAIANGGKLIRPRLVKTIVSSKGNAQDQPVIVDNDSVVPGDVISVVRDGMRLTVTAGSAHSVLGNFPIEVAAKTGTAQTSHSKDKTHSWFTCFAPFNNPEIAISVIVEGGGEGYAVAAPVARNTLESYFGLPITPIIPVVVVDESQ